MKFTNLVQDIQEKASPTKKEKSAPIIITANQRQARFVRQQLAGNLVIHLPEVTTLEQWVKNTWLYLQDLGTENTQKLLIDNKQEAFIWEELINDEGLMSNEEQISSEEDNSEHSLKNPLPALIDTESIAQYIRDAYLTINSYAIPLEQLNASHEVEAQFLCSRIPYFEKYLEKRHLCNQVQALKIIQSTYQKGTITRYSHAYLYGFIETYPSLEHLLETITEGYSHIDDTPSEAPAIQRHEFNDDNHELEMAAHWAKAQLKQKPEQKIAVIVPNLTEVKSRIERTFLKVLDPDFYCDNRLFETNRYFDISASDKLGDTPVIKAVLSLLHLSQKALKKDHAKHIVSNPFWGQGIDNARLHLLEWVNFYNTPTIDTNLLARELAKIETRMGYKITTEDGVTSPTQQDDLFVLNETHSDTKIQSTEEATDNNHIINENRTKHTPAQQLLDFRLQLRKTNKQSSYAQWCEWLIEQLHIIGWPGPRTLNSYEYQAVQSFFTLLTEMQHFDNVRGYGSVSLHKFTQQLNRNLTQTPFHVQTTNAPIQILGLMEAAGLPFDACWITSMSEQQLPASPNPNPFIPLELQIAYDTPRSSPAREFAYAQKLVAQLCNHNQSLIFSHSHSGENIFHPSPFIAHVPLTEVSTDIKEEKNAISLSYIAALGAINAQTTSLFDIVALGSAPVILEGESIKGGSYHLGLHAKNPLYAFLNYRVGAIIPNEESIGINPMERGTLIHALMAHIYTENQNQADMKIWLTSENYRDELTQLIKETLNSYLNSQQRHVPLLLQEVEIDLLFERADRFLNLESERPNFDIYAVEKATEIAINKRHIRLRIDRIDSISCAPTTTNNEVINHSNTTKSEKTTNKELIVFDYKSGSTSLSGLQTNPIYDCQLPLYILALNSVNSSAVEKEREENVMTISATGYIELSAKNIAYIGICQNKERDIPGFVEPHKLTKKQLPDSWEDTLNWWHNQINVLVTEISLGQNHYQHRHPQQLIHYTHLASAIREEEINFTQHIHS